MRKVIWLLSEIMVLAIAVVLSVLSQDAVSMALALVMTAIVAAAIGFGCLPLNRYLQAFHTATENINQIMESKPESPWEMVLERDSFFSHKELDRLFREYVEEIQQQRRYGIVLNDVSKVVNEDLIHIRSWQGVLQQIPGTLTGLGILGTFVGLILGLRDIQFRDMTTAITSIQGLLSGIGTAFYTSIVGVILSILFNILNKMLWNVTVRELDLFTEQFYRYIIPSEEEQYRIRQRREMQEILNRMDHMPSKGDLSGLRMGSGKAGPDQNETQLLNQIQEGLANGEFTFCLQPIFDLNTRKIIGAEALVRWNHPKMGMVSPAVFMPTIERNGYVTKLDNVIWEEVCQTLRRWIDHGMAVVPITINISKMDILALDVAAALSDLIDKYRIPPMYIEVDISETAYAQAQLVTVEAEKSLRQRGLRVAIDDFGGDFMALSSIEGLSPDLVKLDVGRLWKQKGSLESAAQQAAKMKVGIAAVGVENMEMMAELRRKGFNRGQGYYLAKPISIASFEHEINRS